MTINATAFRGHAPGTLLVTRVQCGPAGRPVADVEIRGCLGPPLYQQAEFADLERVADVVVHERVLTAYDMQRFIQAGMRLATSECGSATHASARGELASIPLAETFMDGFGSLVSWCLNAAGDGTLGPSDVRIVHESLKKMGIPCKNGVRE